MNEISDLSSATSELPTSDRATDDGSADPASASAGSADDLSGGIAGTGAGSGSGSGAGAGGRGGAGFDLQPSLDKMQKDLLRTHRERESELQDEIDAERRTKQALSRKLRALITQYRVARDRVRVRASSI